VTRSDPATRITVLALLAAAAAAAAVVATRAPAAAEASTHRPPAHRCSARRRTASAIDERVARLVAPSTTVHLAKPFRVTPELGPSRYVFPLLGPYPPFWDTFDVPRDVGWHHGDDLFADRGAPVLAVATGVVFSVGWNRIGGWRLWLLDRSGNEFYYAHLERFSAVAVDGRRVRAGQVLGYVGTSGDARTTPPHLFFEINPAGLRALGYDGAVDPTSYLRAWRELRAPTPTVPPRTLAQSGCA
jgi:murein DD-endopeptidase MepM/ murein hydrolase activator NlpD